MSVVLLADDLSGACDVGSAVPGGGHGVRVGFVRNAGKPTGPMAGGVTVLDLETRRLSKRAAVRRAAMTGKWLCRHGARAGYLKIDSTLRGHPVAEAEALRRATGSPLAWLVPANPGMGRTTVGGHQFVHGVRLEATTYARDPVHRVATGDLVALAAMDLGAGSVTRLPLPECARGAEHVRRLRAGWLARGIRLVIPDVRTDRDLARLAACIPRTDFVAGAAALVKYLHGHAARRAHPGRARRSVPRTAGRGLAVVGSLNPVSTEQIRRTRSVPGVEVRTLGPRELGRRVPVPQPATRWCILTLDAPRVRRLVTRRAVQKERVARALGRAAASIVARWHPRVLFLSGGLTAAAVCEALGIPELVLRGEPEPGVFAADARCTAGSFRVLTKPGGFGAPGVLARVMRGG